MTTRTPKDYAIEHAGYLADAANAYLAAISSEQIAQMEYEEEDSMAAEGALNDTAEASGEARSRLVSRIYEFEKRRDRAAALPERLMPVQQAVEHLRFALQYAYQQGLHEFGYDPLDALLASIPPNTPEDALRRAGAAGPLGDVEVAAGVDVPVPSGWKLVPIEPTEQMLLEADQEASVCTEDLCRVVWKTMLAAAPAGVEGRCYQTFSHQTPIPSPMDSEREG